MTFTRLIAVALVGAGCLAGPPAGAMDAVMVGTLKVEMPWTRATPASANAGGGYVTITNTGDEDDRLVSVSTGKAAKTQIHEMSVVDGVMRMRELEDGLAIPAGEAVELKPGGYHVMMMGLKGPIAEGETVEVTLTFEKAGSATIAMPAAPIGAKEPMMMDHSGHN